MSALAWLFALAGVVSLDARMIPPVLPAIALSLGVSAGEVGLSVTAYAFAYGVMQVVYGPLSDRFGRIRVIRATALLFAAGTLVSGLAGSLGGFVWARLLTGMFAAATIPTTFAYIGDTVRYEERQKVVGRFTVVFSGAQALSAALAGTVTYFISWRLLFVAYAALTLAAALAMGRAGDTPPRPPAGGRLTYWQIVTIPAARRVYVAAFVEGFFLWGGNTYFGALASQRFGWNDLQVGLVVAVYGVGTILGGLTLGHLASRLGERALAIQGGVLQMVGFAALALPLPWPLLAAGLFANGLGLALLHSTLQTRGTELVPAVRGKSFALFALGLFLGGAAGTAVIGRLVDAGLIGPAMLMCGVGLLAVGRFVAGPPTRTTG